MERTYLIQRLKKPVDFDNPFSFGGGLQNGGLSKNAMKLVRGIWSFDYMGCAEFEFGAIPESLGNIANYCTKGNVYTNKISFKKEIYYLCKKGLESNVEDTIRKLSRNEIDLKEPCFLKQNIDGVDSAEKYRG